MRITLVIHCLQSGGAERVMTTIANYWAAKGEDVTLITWVEPSRIPAYPLHPQINLRQIGIASNSTYRWQGLISGLKRIPKLRQAIQASHPDIIISFMNTVNVTTLIARWGLNTPIIVSDHIYPGFEDANKIWHALMKITYKWADRITVLTDNALPFYPAKSGYRAVVMPNPVLAPQIEDPHPPNLLPPHSLLAIGRLHPQKGFDLLLQAFAQVRQHYPQWQLTILGEGTMRRELEDLRNELGLDRWVHLPGRVPNVNDYLAQADLYVMSSRFEGFPMALCEAMAIGTPVLSTDCLSGPREIITNGVNGVLVPPHDVDALATGIIETISNPELIAQIAHNAPQIIDRFGLDRVMEMWADLIKESIGSKLRIKN
jgi:GalNAc-alpha-(1->4)-GalNAc-alpha-(1->3)-diNAcBac-PP-undecaprenol alpha-1,4-N-acetyl-D-galactosaminyltransferase